jgi:acetyl-CoA C-acetyltransferase
MVLMTPDEANRRGAASLGRLVGWTMASGHPDKLASIPAVTAKLALERTGLTIDDIDVLEINEAFAAMPLVSTLILGDHDPARVEAIRAKTNVNGGAIALGHPTGATGARLVMTMLYELGRRRAALGPGRPLYGLATICGGIGEGEAIVVRVD